VTDTSGVTDTDTIDVTVTSGPVASIDSPAAGSWKAGDTIAFAGSATDEEDGTLPDAALDWSVSLVDCAAGDCHEHALGAFERRAGATVTAPDHPAPAQLEIRLTATDSDGEADTDVLRLDPQVATLALGTSPPGATLLLNDGPVTAPATKQVVVGSRNTLTAAAQQAIGNTTYRFSSWSDGQPRAREFAMPAAGAAFHAAFAPVEPGTHTLTFAAEADARVEQQSPEANFGTSSSLRMDRASSGAEETVDTFIRFAAEGLVGRVTSATLRLRSTANTMHGVAVHNAGGGWSETALTWSNQPPSAAAPIGQVGAIAAQQWAEWDVTPAVAADGAVNLRLSATGDDGVTFHSREAVNETLRPQLVVTVVNDAYVRPAGAPAVRFPLVPAHQECTSPNRMHGTPLAHPSCSPPAQSSSELTVGTGDVNGQTARSVGSATFKVLAGIPSTPADEADVRVQVSITDVRRRADLADYTGGLQARLTVRITDRAGTPATVTDIEVPVDVPCATTPAGIGSTCAVSTTLDALNPGAIDEGARAVWQLGALELLDGGPDGDTATPGNSVFARPGVFVP
jgi:hypothetical protein